ncbi:Tensin, partial [Trichinella patagoniensis]
MQWNERWKLSRSLFAHNRMLIIRKSVARMRGGNGNLSSVQLVFFCCSCCCPIDFIYKVQHLHAVLPSPGNIVKSSQRTRNLKVTRNNSCQLSSMLTFAFAGCDDLYSKSVQLTIKMLASKHDGKFKIFNVSKERSELANLNVFECGWPECLAPALEKLCTICKEMDRWLELSTENVVVIHQKGGFRRAAVVVSAFMHYCSICASESQMLEHLAMQQYCKQHSLLPSQRRYVQNFANLLSERIQVNSEPVVLYTLVVRGLTKRCPVYFKIYGKMVPVFTSNVVSGNAAEVLVARFRPPVSLRGDILLKCCSAEDEFHQKCTLFQCQFNTCTVNNHSCRKIVFKNDELDYPISENLSLELFCAIIEPNCKSEIYPTDDDNGNNSSNLSFNTSNIEPVYLEPSTDNSFNSFEWFYDHNSSNEDGSKAEQQSSGGTTLAMRRRRTATTPPPRDADPILEPDPEADLDVDHDRATETGKDNGRKKRWLSRGSVESGRRDVEPALERPVVVDVRGKRASFDVVTADSLGIVDVSPFRVGRAGVDRETRAPHWAPPQTRRVIDTNYGPFESPFRPPAVVPPGKRAASPAPVRGHHARASPTVDKGDIDVDLVGEDRYDPQSRAFSYVPAQSLEEHFRAPKKPTKLVPAFKYTDNWTVADEPLEAVEENPASARVPNFDDLCDPNFYLNFDNGRLSGTATESHNGAETDHHALSLCTDVSVDCPIGDQGSNAWGADDNDPQQQQQPAAEASSKPSSTRHPSTFHSNNYHSPLSAATLDSRWSPSPSSRGDFHFDDLTLGLEPLQTRRYQHRPGQQQLLLFDCSEPTTPRPFNNRCPSPNFYRNRQKLQVETRPVYTPTAWEERFLGGLGDQWDDSQRVSMSRRPLYYGNSLPEWPAESDADSISAGGPVDSESWLDLQMQKLKIRREVNDPARRRRREQERLLLEELKQVQHVDGGRGRFGRHGAVAGAVAGSKGAPLMDESTASAVSSISNSSPGRANEESHTITITTNNNTAATTTTTPPHHGFTRRKTNNANTTTVPTSDHDTSPLLDVQSTVGRNRDGLWSSSSSSHRHACYNPHQTNFDHCYYYSNTLSSTKSASSPKSILKKPKSFPAQPFVSPSYQATEELQSGNYYHDQVDGPDSSSYLKSRIDNTLASTDQPDYASSYMLNSPARVETPAFPVRRMETPLPYHPLLYAGASTDDSRMMMSRVQNKPPPPPPPMSIRSLSPGSHYYAHSECLSKVDFFVKIDPPPPTVTNMEEDGNSARMDGPRYITTSSSSSSCSACPSESNPTTNTTATTTTTTTTTITPNAEIVDPMSPLKMIDDLFTSWKTKTMEVVHHHPVFVKDTSKYWYKPQISREETISVLKDKQPGSFIIRDSSSFPGAFGLALKVATAPPGVMTKGNSDGSELVRHFLIETTAKGVKLKGCNNEPVFGSLAALVYQHSITPLALPCKLLLPDYDPAVSVEQVTTAQQLLEQGAACNVTYLYSNETESLTGPEAIRRTIDSALVLSSQKKIEPLNVHFKVSSQDNARKVFFRRHYPVQTITHCGLDPENRQWCCNSNSGPARIYGFVARKSLAKSENVCHLFAELEPEQPASAICQFFFHGRCCFEITLPTGNGSSPSSSSISRVGEEVSSSRLVVFIDEVKKEKTNSSIYT